MSSSEGWERRGVVVTIITVSAFIVAATTLRTNALGSTRALGGPAGGFGDATALAAVHTHASTKALDTAFAFFPSLSREPVPVNISGLSSGGEISRAAISELALTAKLGRVVTVSDVCVYVIDKDHAQQIASNTSYSAQSISAGTLLKSMDVFRPEDARNLRFLLLETKDMPICTPGRDGIAKPFAIETDLESSASLEPKNCGPSSPPQPSSMPSVSDAFFAATAAAAAQAEAFDLRNIPFGTVWQRWDANHATTHATWILEDARVVLDSSFPEGRHISMRGDRNRKVSLPVRGGTFDYFDSSQPPKCTSYLPLGFLAIIPNSLEFNNFWHFNADEFMLDFHTVMAEVAAGMAQMQLSPSGEKKALMPAIYVATLPLGGSSARGGLITDSLPKANEASSHMPAYVHEEVQMLFHGLPDIAWLGPGGPAEEKSVVCIDRLYVGADRQCTVLGDLDSAPESELGECQAVWRLWRATLYELAGVPPPKIVDQTSRPVVLIISRSPPYKHGKVIINAGELEGGIRSLLNARFGPEKADVVFSPCDGVLRTTKAWSTASIVVLSRGACQANMPLVRDGGGLLWIGPCGNDSPQLRPMPSYAHVIVHHPPVLDAAMCNWVNYSVPLDAFLTSLSSLLDKVHGPVQVSPASGAA